MSPGADIYGCTAWRERGVPAEWTCGHHAGAMCASCYRLLAQRAHELAQENFALKEARANAGLDGFNAVFAAIARASGVDPAKLPRRPGPGYGRRQMIEAMTRAALAALRKEAQP